MATLHWEIPKVADGNSWSEMFRKAQVLAEKFSASNVDLPPGVETPQIKDFTITQNSLEQVFLRLANLNSKNETSMEDGINVSTSSSRIPEPAPLFNV